MTVLTMSQGVFAKESVKIGNKDLDMTIDISIPLEAKAHGGGASCFIENSVSILRKHGNYRDRMDISALSSFKRRNKLCDVWRREIVLRTRLTRLMEQNLHSQVGI